MDIIKTLHVSESYFFLRVYTYFIMKLVCYSNWAYDLSSL
jgi:hypothetical protein